MKFFGKLSDGVKSGTVYTVSTLVTKGLVFLTIPVFTRIMPTDQIGIVNIYNSWFSLISIVSTLSLTSGGYQLALKEFSQDKDQYQSSVLTITSLMSLVLMIVYIINPAFWVKISGVPGPLIILLLLGLLFSPAQDFWMTRQRFDYKYKFPALLSISSALLAVGLSIVFVLKCKDPDNMASSRLFANNLVMYGVSAVLWIYTIVKGKTFFNKKYWLFSLSLSVPLIGHAIAKQVLDVSDRMMIDFYIGKGAVGVYGTLYSISSISLIAWNAINASYIPYLYKNIDVKEKKRDIKSSSSIILLSYCALAVFIMMLAPEIVSVFTTKEYMEAINIMPPIAMGVSLTAVSNMYSNILVYYKKTKVIMCASGIAALVNLGLNYLCIPVFGYQAAAYTTLVAYIIMTVIEAVIATKTYKRITQSSEMIYSNRTISGVILFSLLLSFICLLIYKHILFRYIIVFALLIAGVILLRKYWKSIFKNK